MIKVTVELIPFGDEDSPDRQVLGEAIIYNDGTGTDTDGNYRAMFGKRNGHLARPPRDYGKSWLGTWREATVEGFPRKRLLVWDLLYRALHGAVFDRNLPLYVNVDPEKRTKRKVSR